MQTRYRSSRPREHPRSRGENLGAASSADIHHGTSPLTRGKRNRERRGWGLRRNIPAHAGKTPPHPTRRTWPWEHPRSRGENYITAPAVLPCSGTSPLTRGKPRCRRSRNLRTRNIPAHAGKTWMSAIASCSRSEHPRSRGENFTLALPRSPSAGTSPLTRGKRGQWVARRLILRNIPAHAGKTLLRDSGLRQWREHPRSRGENPMSRTMTG